MGRNYVNGTLSVSGGRLIWDQGPLLRVLILVGWAAGYGGVERVTAEVARQLNGRGHTVQIAVDSTGVQSTRWLEGLSWRMVDMNDMKMGAGGRAAKAARLRTAVNLLREVRPDIVLIDIPAWIRTFSFARRLMRWQERAPVVAGWVHTCLEPQDKHALRGYRLADCNFAVSTRQALIIASDVPVGAGKQPPSTYVVNNPLVDPPTAGPTPPSSEARFVYIGRLSAEKRVDLLLYALSLIRGNHWHLDIIGDGPARAKLQSLQDQLKIVDDRVTWHGWQESPWQGVLDATALVLPSDAEAFPLVVIEAAARGIPVVAADTTPPELVDLIGTERLFAAGSIDGLSRKRTEFLDSPSTPRRIERARLQAAAARYAAGPWTERFLQALTAAVLQAR